MLQIIAPNLSITYLRNSCDIESEAADFNSVCIALNRRSEAAFPGRIPVNGGLCASGLESAIHKNGQCKTKSCLFVISLYELTDSSSNNPKNMFYDRLTVLKIQSRSSDIVILAGELNAQVAQISSSEHCLADALHCFYRGWIIRSASFSFVQLTDCFYAVLIFNAIQDKPIPGILLGHLPNRVKSITLLSVSGGVDT